jgi:hypothetical protein
MPSDLCEGGVVREQTSKQSTVLLAISARDQVGPRDDTGAHSAWRQ